MSEYVQGGLFEENPTEWVDKYVRPKENDKIDTVSGLNTRQYRLHGLLLKHSQVSEKRLSNKEILIKLDDFYGYYDEIQEKPNTPFNNLMSRRLLSDDIDAITKDKTLQHVYVGGRYATDEDEAIEYLDKQMVKALKILNKYHIQKKKLSLNGQQRMRFNTEKPEWESILKMSEGVEE